MAESSETMKIPMRMAIDLKVRTPSHPDRYAYAPKMPKRKNGIPKPTAYIRKAQWS